MSTDHLPSTRSVRTAIGSFVRRLTWRREVGPLTAEARVEVRELSTEAGPPSQADTGTPPA
jgi:hypothetical protein